LGRCTRSTTSIGVESFGHTLVTPMQKSSFARKRHHVLEL
jgi:hypothetical protein